MSKIFTVVRNIVAERSGITPKSLEGCTNLEAVGLDGMDMSELIMAIEDTTLEGAESKWKILAQPLRSCLQL